MMYSIRFITASSEPFAKNTPCKKVWQTRYSLYNNCSEIEVAHNGMQMDCAMYITIKIIKISKPTM